MSLSSLIVQREVATIRQVEEALARQVLYGGDLITNVLEVAQVPEGILLPLLAETVHMPHAPVGPLPEPSAEAKALVPQELAVRRSLFPIELSGGRLVVAVAEPLDAEVLDELGFALGVQIEQRVAPLVRIREALAGVYGAPLDRRMQRLLGRLAGVDMPGSGSLPPLLATNPTASLRPPSQVPLPSGAPPRHETPGMGIEHIVRPRPPPRPERVTQAGFPAPAPESQEDLTAPTPPVEERTDNVPLVDERTEKVPPVVVQTLVMVGDAAPPGPPAPAPENPPARALASAPPRGSRPPSVYPPRNPSKSPSAPPAAHPSSLVRLVQDASGARGARRRRGPITLERAKVELEQAADRDALLDLFFDFSRQFFEYSALFIVHGDLAEGRDAYGPGASRQRVLGVGVPLDLPSALSAARERVSPVIARPAKEGLDAVLIADLDRSPDWPILIVPLVVRGRTVALLYGDNGEAGVDGTGSGEVTAFASRVGQAFERVIVRRKLAGFTGDKATQAPRVDPTRVAAKGSKPPRLGDPETHAKAAERLSKALGPEGLVRPSSIPPPPEPGALATAEEPKATGTASAAPAEAETKDEAPSPPAETAPGHPGPQAPTPLRVPAGEADDDVVLPLSNRRTIKDLSPPFPDVTDDAVPADSIPPPGTDLGAAAPPESAPPDTAAPVSPSSFADSAGEPLPAVSTEFGDLPPPKQVAMVRDLSKPPIPREEPALALDLTPAAPRAVTPEPPAAGQPHLDVSHLAPADEETLLRELDALAPGNSDVDLPSVPPSSDSLQKPPPSQAFAVPPHRPPQPRAHAGALPSVIVDVDSEFLTLVERLAKDPADEHAEAELLRQGQYAMPAIMTHFPGPITLSLLEVDEKKARVGDCGPILRLIAGQRRVALPFVLNEVDSENADRRFWATFLLTELAYPEAVPSIVARLFDDEARTRKVARMAAKVVAESAREALVEELDRIVRDPGATVEKRVATMDTLGEMRDAIVVPVLLGALADDSEEVALAARRALTMVTRQDFGRDTRRWLAWWSSASSRHRVEWLIDALTHDQAALRKASAQELKTITREYFGYYDDLPKKERERAQQRYRDWWRTDGRARFRRSSS